MTGFLGQFTAQLSSNPRFVTLLSTVYPAKRGILYRRLIDLLLDNWTQPSPGLPSIMEIFQQVNMPVAEAEKKLIETLGKVAYETVEQFPDRAPRGEALRRSVLHHLGDLSEYYALDSVRVRAYLSENASVLVGTGEHFRFAHEDFRQYFLAEHLLKQIEGSEHPLVRDLMWTRPRIWADPLTMIGDLLVGENHGSLHRVWDLIEDLIGDDPPGDKPSAHAEAVWLAARIAVDQGLGTGRLRRSERDIFDNLVEQMVILLQSPDALVLDTNGVSDCNRRADMGRLLGTLGDTRPGIGLPIDWIDIPAGPAIISGSHPSDPYSPNDPTPRERVDLPAFRIGRYPVTVAQYEAFVAAGGYQERAYWIEGQDESGWIWCRGREHPGAGWHNPRWHIPNHPIIGVTWYEAAAFCRWLSAESGMLVRLPTIAEWIRAARGISDQIFPYGSSFDVSGGNTHLSGTGRTTAVGIFPRGLAESGVADLSGNVYEWCQDEVHEKRLDGQPLLHRALMGGSWSSYPGFCRIDARYSDNPAFATTYWGFRVVSIL